jgi:hypothetical protein
MNDMVTLHLGQAFTGRQNMTTLDGLDLGKPSSSPYQRSLGEALHKANPVVSTEASPWVAH